MRIFEEEKNVEESDDTLKSIKIPDLPRRPVCNWAKEVTVVPPNYVGFVKPYVTGSEPNADAFVDAQPRCQEGREHCIPRCVVNMDAANGTYIAVMSATYQEFNTKADERVARSEVCYLDEEPMQDVKLSCSATRPCSTATANVKTGPSVTPEHREKLDRLIEEYRDCFADSIAEISRTKAAGMKIKMTTEEPVFNTTQRLWLYWKNYTIDTKIPDDLQNHGVANLDLTENCTYIKKINITEAYFHYWWHTMMLGELVRSHYYGAFFSEGGPEKRGSMNVTDLSESEPEPFQTMKLMHMGKDCSVFYVTPLEEDSNAGCELYVRNKVVSQGAPQDCLTYYEDNCKNKTVVYRSGCKSE
ncbi:hypothetical protein MTO96_041803, partial [Rhipicephalus appendiculatus]